MNTLDARRIQPLARRLLPSFVVLSLLLGATQALGGERPEAKREAVKQETRTRSPDPATTWQGPERATGPFTDFRADKIVPDICKGCST